jgi:hypothetical protein
MATFITTAQRISKAAYSCLNFRAFALNLIPIGMQPSTYERKTT